MQNSQSTQSIVSFAPAVDGQQPTPNPDLLTWDEAGRYLRLPHTDEKNVKCALQHLRENRGLRGILVGGYVLYPLVELQRWTKEQLEKRPR